jgi:hypothetical protein
LKKTDLQAEVLKIAKLSLKISPSVNEETGIIISDVNTQIYA